MKAILTWHSVDASGSPISVAPDVFERQLDSLVDLARHGVRIVALTEVERTTSPALALTFDDGFLNFASIAWPRLAERDLPVTLFVVAGRLGATNRWGGAEDRLVPELDLLEANDIRLLAEEGVAIGCHGARHAHLPGLDEAGLERETRGAAAELERISGRRPESFAYPFGSHDERTADFVRPQFRCAVTTEHRLLTNDCDRARLPRLDAWYFADGFSAFGTRRFAAAVSVRHALRRVRRAVRRPPRGGP